VKTVFNNDNLIPRDAYAGLFRAVLFPRSNFPPAGSRLAEAIRSGSSKCQFREHNISAKVLDATEACSHKNVSIFATGEHSSGDRRLVQVKMW